MYSRPHSLAEPKLTWVNLGKIDNVDAHELAF